MIHYLEAFGRRVRGVIEEAGLSPNRVELLSERRISHTTVRRMLWGYPPSSDHIIEFAEAVGKERGWEPHDVKRLAYELLTMVDSRARHYAG